MSEPRTAHRPEEQQHVGHVRCSAGEQDGTAQIEQLSVLGIECGVSRATVQRMVHAGAAVPGGDA